jgi:hypothetical protein
MQHASTIILNVAIELFDLVVAAIVLLEGMVRKALTGLGIGGAAQTVILAVVTIMLVVAAFRAFGRLFAILIVVFVLLLLLHATTGSPAKVTPFHNEHVMDNT